MKSQPITISRYSNGTLVKLSVSDSAFVSYDFDPKKNTGTYTPTSITITPTFSGGVKFGSWRYSTDGATFQNIASGQHGFTINGGAVILAATSDLYATTNSAVIVACVGDDPTYFDTVTIMRYVDPTFVFRQTSTAIKQTNDKISLIATEEQLAKYGSKFTVLDDLQAQIDVIPSKISLAVKEEHGIITGEMNTALAEYATLETMESRLTMTAQDITSTVSATYQTIADAEDDLDEAKSYADDKATQLESKITQTANSITSTVSQNYQSKTDAASDLNNAKTYADNKNAALKTEIKQTTDSISSTVSKKVGKDEIISSINQSAESIKINANKVNITGFVTFNNLKNSGETTINGSNITTGKIHDANNNMVLDLSTGAITAKKLSVISTYFTLMDNGYCYWGGPTGSKIGIENGIIKAYWSNQPTGAYIDCTSSYRIRASRFFVSEGASADLEFHRVATTEEKVVTSVSNGYDTKENVIGSVSLNAGLCTAQTTTIYYKNTYGGNAWTTVVTGINYRAPYLQSSSKSVVTASGKASGSTKTIRVFYGEPIKRHLVVSGGIVTTYT